LGRFHEQPQQPLKHSLSFRAASAQMRGQREQNAIQCREFKSNATTHTVAENNSVPECDRKFHIEMGSLSTEYFYALETLA